MGVPGLWHLLEPVRQPIDIQQLTGTIVAIDMNIWLHQAIKSSGGPRNYLAIFFWRLCKLLFYGIRPVFVFDGDAPSLKKMTMATRKVLRQQLGSRAEQAQKRYLRRLLTRIAEATVKNHSSDETSMNSDYSAKQELLRHLTQRTDVLQSEEDAKLFSVPTNENIGDQSKPVCLLDENAGLEYNELAHDFLDGYNFLDDPTKNIDLESDAFCSLPLLCQLRVMQLIRDQLDSSVRSHSTKLEQLTHQITNAELFSTNQMNRLILRRRLAKRQEEVSNLIEKEKANEQMLQLNCSYLLKILRQQSGAPMLAPSSSTVSQSEQQLVTEPEKQFDSIATALRIQSKDAGHAILIKQSPVKRTKDGTYQRIKPITLNLDSLIGTSPTTSEIEPISSAINSPNQPTEFLHMGPKFQPESSPLSAVSHNASSTLTMNSKTPLSSPSNSSLYEDSSSDSHVNGTHQSTTNITTLIQHNGKANEIILDLVEPCPINTSSDDGSFDVALNNVKSEVLCSSIEYHLNQPAGSELKHFDQSINSEDEQESDHDDFLEVPTSSSPVNLAASALLEENDTTLHTQSLNPVSTLPVEHSNVAEEQWDDFTIDDVVLREETDRLTRQAQTTTSRFIRETQDLLRLFGVPFIDSPEEGEAQCAALQRCGLVDIVASDDSDVWPFGSHLVCRYLFGKGTRNANSTNSTRLHQPSLYDLNNLESKLGLDTANILRLTLLCGSDYTHGVVNVGPVGALEILGEFAELNTTVKLQLNKWLQGSLEISADLIDAILEPLKSFNNWLCSRVNKTDEKLSAESNLIRSRWLNVNPPANFPDPRIVRAYLCPKVVTNLKPFTWESPDVKMLIKYASSTLGYTNDKTEAMLNTVFQHQQTMLAGSPVTNLITNYFMPAGSKMNISNLYSNNVVEDIKLSSKRARDASERLRHQLHNVPSATKYISRSAILSSANRDKCIEESCNRHRKNRATKDISNDRVDLPRKQSKRERIRKMSHAKKNKPQRRVVDRVALSEED